MLTKRIIACLDVRDGQVVKGVQFQGLRHAGDPGELARRYNVEGIDEVVILDITATLEKRQALARTIGAVAKEIFLPLTVGGGIRSEEDADAAVEAGADKVSLNTAALKDPQFVKDMAREFPGGVVVAVEGCEDFAGAFEDGADIGGIADADIGRVVEALVDEEDDRLTRGRDGQLGRGVCVRGPARGGDRNRRRSFATGPRSHAGFPGL